MMKDSRGKFLRQRRRRSRKKSRRRRSERTTVYLPVGGACNAYRAPQIESDNSPVNGPILPSRIRQILLTCHTPDVISSSCAEVLSSA